MGMRKNIDFNVEMEPALVVVVVVVMIASCGRFDVFKGI